MTDCAGHLDDALHFFTFQQFALGLFVLTDIHKTFDHTGATVNNRLRHCLVDGNAGSICFKQDMFRIYTGVFGVFRQTRLRPIRVDKSAAFSADHIGRRQPDHVRCHGIHLHNGMINGIHNHDAAGNGFDNGLDPLTKQSILNC